MLFQKFLVLSNGGVSKHKILTYIKGFSRHVQGLKLEGSELIVISTFGIPHITIEVFPIINALHFSVN